MIDSLRLSVTQRCDLNCPYCHREGQLESDEEMSIDKIRNILESARNHGVSKLKITGGEPLLRADITKIVSTAKELGFEDISMVTNGRKLDSYAQALKDAGLNRVNIGCDSIDSQYLKNKERMKLGLKACKDAGIDPIKMNMVVLKDINHHEMEEMISFARENGAILQLIELINTDKEFFRKHYFSLKEKEEELRARSDQVIHKKMHNRKQYDLGDVKVEVVRPFHNNFCENCIRLRVTSDGNIKTCLLRNDNLIPYEGDHSFKTATEIKRCL